MTSSSPFDHRPDAEIGSALRELLSSSDDQQLATRIMAAAAALLGQAGTQRWTDVLFAWARPGVAAAMVLAAAATLWMSAASRQPERDLGIDEALQPGSEVAPPVLVAATTAPELDRLMWTIPDPE